MDANLHGSRAAQDLSSDSVPKTPAEQHEENLVGFYSKLSDMLQEETFVVTDHVVISWQHRLCIVLFDSVLNE
jgi:hypothetical protein